jgi:hypothetical protein
MSRPFLCKERFLKRFVGAQHAVPFFFAEAGSWVMVGDTGNEAGGMKLDDG